MDILHTHEDFIERDTDVNVLHCDPKMQFSSVLSYNYEICPFWISLVSYAAKGKFTKDVGENALELPDSSMTSFAGVRFQ